MNNPFCDLPEYNAGRYFADIMICLSLARALRPRIFLPDSNSGRSTTSQENRSYKLNETCFDLIFQERLLFEVDPRSG